MTKDPYKITVKKSNGSIERFDPGKIAQVVQAAGLKTEEAAILATKVALWAVNQNKAVIKSSMIRTKVTQMLKKVSKSAANLFIWYKKNEG
ncbi:MAG: hypothetical protein JW991_05465 [Candidatus Pacebacteria bacterium]|nr:hypothetical protein [Candidatus Paceibacterota bacterium]